MFGHKKKLQISKSTPKGDILFLKIPFQELQRTVWTTVLFSRCCDITKRPITIPLKLLRMHPNNYVCKYVCYNYENAFINCWQYNTGQWCNLLNLFFNYKTSVSHSFIYLWGPPQYQNWPLQIDFPKGLSHWINRSIARFKIETLCGCFYITVFLKETDCLQKIWMWF